MKICDVIVLNIEEGSLCTILPVFRCTKYFDNIICVLYMSIYIVEVR